jgi:hypothetical protein
MNHHRSARWTPRRHVRSRAMPITPRGGQRSSSGTSVCPRPTSRVQEARLPMFNSPHDNLSAAMARLQQANPSPAAEAAMAYLQVATALVEEKSAASKSTASSCVPAPEQCVGAATLRGS